MAEEPVAIETTRTACAGAASAFAFRHLAARAGTYAPGIDEALFFGLTRDTVGVDLVEVASWFAARVGELNRRGYRIGWRLVAFRTDAIKEWVAGGDGYRAAVLATACQVLHPDVGNATASAVALVLDRKTRKGALRMGDPWPGAPNLRDVSPSLGEAHRRVMHRALLFYWAGWS